LRARFVFIERAPTSSVGLLTMFLFVLTGLSVPTAITPLIILLVLLNLGYATAVVQVLDQSKPVIWVCVSAFLAMTAIFYASMLAHSTETRLKWLLRGYVAAAVIASLAGIIGYAQVSGASPTCSCATAARAAPSTIRTCSAPSWCCPGLLLLQRVLAGRRSQVLAAGSCWLISWRRCSSRSRAPPGACLRCARSP